MGKVLRQENGEDIGGEGKLLCYRFAHAHRFSLKT